MTMLQEMAPRLRGVLWPILGALLLCYFAYHMVQGEHGMLAWLQLRARLVVAETERGEVAIERARLEARVALLDPAGVDPDMLEEQARRLLNYAWPDELVVLEQPR